MFRYWKSPVTLGVVGVLCLIIGGVSVWWFTRSSVESPLPPSVTSQIDFAPFIIPEDSTNPSASDYKVTTVEDGTQVLVYSLTVDDQKVSVSQYPQPSQFNDVPDFRAKFLEDTIQQTASVSTASGVIILGQMAKQNNKQMAILLERGLIVFFAPEGTLDETQWRKVGNHLEVVKN